MDALTDTALAKFQQQGSAQIHPVILSGGAGTRLWPLSRAAYPKQLLPLVSERTLLQETAARNLSDAELHAIELMMAFTAGVCAVGIPTIVFLMFYLMRPTC